jgi:hypothetical protein
LSNVKPVSSIGTSLNDDEKNAQDLKKWRPKRVVVNKALSSKNKQVLGIWLTICNMVILLDLIEGRTLNKKNRKILNLVGGFSKMRL